jgi:hypothetical protein
MQAKIEVADPPHVHGILDLRVIFKRRFQHKDMVHFKVRQARSGSSLRVPDLSLKGQA